jgi:GNAT superfamily N-acetyltransferase
MREHVIATWGSWNDARVHAESVENASLPDARVVLVDAHSAGVMIAKRHPTHIQLEQLYLLPSYQAKGIGTLLMRNLLSEAKASSTPVRLRVLRVNPARRFYEKFGFSVALETPERFHMEWSV